MIPVAPSDFCFTTDEESLAYLREIVEDMMRRFGINRDESIARLNQAWSHWPSVTGEYELYREKPAYWAHDVMFGHDSFWWLSEAERKRHSLGPLQRRPYDKAHAAQPFAPADGLRPPLS